MAEVSTENDRTSWFWKESESGQPLYLNFNFLHFITIWMPSIAFWLHIVIVLMRRFKHTATRKSSLSSDTNDTISVSISEPNSLNDGRETFSSHSSIMSSDFHIPVASSFRRPKLFLCFCSAISNLLFALFLKKAAATPTPEHNVTRVTLTFTYLSQALAFVTQFVVLYLTHKSTSRSRPSKNGLSSSSLSLRLFMYWLGLTLFHVLPMHREFEDAIHDTSTGHIDGRLTIWTSPRNLIRNYFIFAAISSTLNFFIHGSAPNQTIVQKSSISPYTTASYFSKLTFFWFSQTILRGYRKELNTADLDELPDSFLSSKIESKFETSWKRKKMILEPGPRDTCQMTETKDKAKEKDLYSDVECAKLADKGALAASSFTSASATMTMLGCYAGRITGLLLLDLCRICLELGKPIVLGWLLGHISEREQRRQNRSVSDWRGYGNETTPNEDSALNGSVYTANDNYENNKFVYRGLVLTFFLVLVSSLDFLVRWLYLWSAYNVGIRVKTGLVSAIYTKFLNLDPDVKRRECASGEMINLMNSDAPRFVDVCYLLEVAVMPLELFLYFWLLTKQLGWGFVAGLVFLCLLMPVNWIASKKLTKYHKHQMSLKDSRVKLLFEVLNGIKAVKLHVWEKFFAQKIGDIREEEIANQKRVLRVEALVTFFAYATPFLVGAISFSAFTIIGTPSPRPLTAEIVFVSLALFEKLRRRLSWLLKIVVNWSKLLISKQRIDKFMTTRERTHSLDGESVDHKNGDTVVDHENVAIFAHDASFSWDNSTGETVLADLNFTLKRGTVHSVIGPVGAGKSSLLLALLGEMRRVEGQFGILGSVAYVSQHPWLKNATLKENILFGNVFVAEKYRRTIDACALRQDVDSLPAGDATEIGDRGVNLSGGQRLRISLARAVYAEADVYLLDDPLSAVDAQVGNHIFDRVLGVDGILSGKTRLIVTSNVNYLSTMDTIIALRKGTIVEMGPYADLMENKRDVADLVKRYSCEVENKRNAQSYEKQIDDQTEKTDKEAEEENGPERGGVKRRVWSTYFRATGWFVCLLGLLSAILVRSFEAAASIFIAHLTDRSSAKSFNVDDANATTPALQNGLVIYDALCGLASLSVIGVACCHLMGSVSAARQFHKRLTKRVLSFPMAFFETVPLGSVMNRFSSDIAAIDGKLHNSFYDFVTKIVGFFATMVVIGVSEPWILILLPLLCVYFFSLQKVYQPASRQLRRIHDASKSLILSHFGETVQGVETIRAFGVEGHFRSEFRRLLDDNTKAQIANHTSTAWIAICIHSFSVTVLIACCLLSILGEGNTSGMAGLAITSAFVICTHLGETIKTFTDLEKNLIAVERVEEYLNMDGEEEKEGRMTSLKSVKKNLVVTNFNKNNFVDSYTHILVPAIVDPRNPLYNLPTQGSSIVFHEYSARYRSHLNPALDKVQLDISPGDKIGVVGRTGSGKSSLAMALLRVLEPSEGTILIDGVPIASISRADLRSSISFIPQDPVIFSESLRFNLDPLNEYSDEEIERVVHWAHLEEMIESFQPEGLDHKCREAGADLSIGQRQLLCLARAMLKRSRIVILDEATASVDPRTNQIIQRAVDQVFRRSSTVILVSHRLQDVLDCDKIIFMQRGAVVESGRPSDLMREPAANDGGHFLALAREAGIL